MKRVALSLLSVVLASGCMHRVTHQLPPNAYFGHVPARPDQTTQSFAADGMKNWWLAGLVPYTSWNSKDLIPQGPGVERVENLVVQTEFSTVDTIVWVIPGFAYGYYVWAPRTVTVRGSKVVHRERPAMNTALVWLVLAAHTGAHADPAWEVNGIRLEASQVEQLADDLAERTVGAVTTKVSALGLADGQRAELHAIYRAVALDTYERVIPVVQDTSLDEAARQERVRALVLEGQRASHEKIKNVLDPRQMELYAAWEATQVAAFQSRRLDRRRSRSR